MLLCYYTRSRGETMPCWTRQSPVIDKAQLKCEATAKLPSLSETLPPVNIRSSNRATQYYKTRRPQGSEETTGCMYDARKARANVNKHSQRLEDPLVQLSQHPRRQIRHCNQPLVVSYRPCAACRRYHLSNNSFKFPDRRQRAQQ